MKKFLKRFAVNFSIASIFNILGLTTLFGVYLILPHHISYYNGMEVYLRTGGIVIFATIMMGIAVSVVQKFSVIENKLKKFFKYEED